jgi:hypothetical protein
MGWPTAFLHAVDGGFDRGLGEEIVAPHHVQHGADCQVAAALHLLTHEAQHLTVDHLGVDVALEVIFVDDIAGAFADPGHFATWPCGSKTRPVNIAVPAMGFPFPWQPSSPRFAEAKCLSRNF